MKISSLIKLNSFLLILVCATSTYAINTRDGFATKAFGPSPQGVDSSKIFAVKGVYMGNATGLRYNSFWEHMSQRFNAIYLHILLYADSSANFGSIPENQNSIKLTSSQIKGLKYLQKSKGFRVIVDTGLSLGPENGGNCDTSMSLSTFAENAAVDDFNQLTKLIDSGVKIDEIAVDGPFLRLVRGSEKAYSCSTGSSGGRTASTTNAFTNGQAATIVAKYLGRITRKIRDRHILRGMGSYSPKVTLALNLPNLPLVGSNYSYHGHHSNVEFDSILQHFSRRSEYSSIHEIVFDYPYSYLLNTSGNLSTYKRNLFNNKLVHLSGKTRHIRGNPKLSFILNTEGNFKAPSRLSRAHNTYYDSILDSVGNVSGYRAAKYCILVGSKLRKNELNSDRFSSNNISHLKVWNENLCYMNFDWNMCSRTSNNNCNRQVQAKTISNLAGRRNNYVRAENNRYINHSSLYYRRVRNSLPSAVRKGSIYFTSWHDFPRDMRSYGYGVRKILIDNN